MSRNDQNRTFDWEAARQRIAAARATLDHEMAPEILERIWSQRAAQLAKPPAKEEEGEQLELVQIRLGREIYAIDAQFVYAIRLAQQVTLVPRVPKWIAGVINLSGRIMSVIDLRLFFGLEGAETENNEKNAPAFLLVIETPEMELAFLVDEVLEVVSLADSRVQDTFDTVRGIRPEYVSGAVELAEADSGERGNLMVVLNIPALLSDERLVIHEEIT